MLGLAFFIMNAVISVGCCCYGRMGRDPRPLPGYRLGIGAEVAIGYLVNVTWLYWFHRARHSSPVLWRWLHQLHHSPRRVDAAGFAVAHPFDVMAQTVLSLVVLIGLLGLNPAAAALVGLYAAIAELVQHLNIRTPRWLEWFMQRPEAHQRHHEFGQHAGNYADWPVWDRLLGTYRAPAQAPLPYGFSANASRRFGAMLLCIDVNRNEGPIVRHD